MRTVAGVIKSGTTTTLSVEAEQALIGAAQAGDEDATLDLISQYSRAARAALSRFRDHLDEEDALQEVAGAFMEIIRTHDPEKSPRIAGRVSNVLRRVLSEAASSGGTRWAIPARTLDRFYAILRAADGDPVEGERIAPEHGMAGAMFATITAMLRETGSLDGDLTGQERETVTYALDGSPSCAFTEVDDALLVDYLFTTLDADEVDVVEVAYGFRPAEIGPDTLTPEGAAPLSDSIVSAALGLSRQKVQRARAGALRSMRSTLEIA